jgi:acyl-CoA hydrolase
VREGETKGYVNVVGTALGPIIPRYFNTIVMASKIGSGKFIKRSIVTASTPEVDLKNPVSFKLGETLPLETGLATVVASLRAG